MRNAHHNKNKIMRYSAFVLAVVFLISASLLFVNIWERHRSKFPTTYIENTFIEYDGKEYVLKDNIETFLILGLDKYDRAKKSDSYNNDKQADFLMLFVFDNDLKKCSAVQINRDTMVNVNVLGVAGNKVDTVTKQIALAHTYGNGKDVSCRNTADSVSELFFGVKVNHYISFTMDSVKTLNDLVGGVNVTVLDDFAGVDDTLVKGENVTLTGEQALTYVHARYGLDDSTNSTRMKRQKQYVDALYDKMITCIENDDKFIVEASVKMSPYIVSDRSLTQLQEFTRKLNEYELVEISEVEGESKLGDEFVEFYPNQDFVKQMVIELFYEPKN